MADEILKREGDYRNVMGAVTNDASLNVRMLRVDPSTGRLLVDAAVSITKDNIPAGSLTQALAVQVVDGSGNQITSFGGSGGNAAASATGAAVPASADYLGISDGSNLVGVLQAKNALNSTGGGLLTAQIIGQFDDVAPTSITENQFGNIRMSANRNLYGTIRDAAGNERGLNVDANGGIAITLEAAQTLATVTAVTTVTTVTNVGAGNAAATIAADAVTPTVPGMASYGFIKTTGANTWDRIQPIQNATDSVGTGIQAAGIVGQFDDVSPGTVTENRFGNIRMSVRREIYDQIRDAAGNERGLNITSRNSALVEGPTASGSAVAASPLTIGGRAASANPTAVTDGQVVNTMHDLKGRPVAQLGQVRELRGKQTTTISASTSETTIVTAAASTFNDLVALVISNTSASTNTRIDFRDTTSGTILFSLQAPGNQVVGFVLPGASIPQTTVNTNWTAQCGTSTTDIRALAIFEKNT